MFEQLEADLEPRSTFEFDLGMSLAVLIELFDNAEDLTEEDECFLYYVDELVEKFSVKYADWIGDITGRTETLD